MTGLPPAKRSLFSKQQTRSRAAAPAYNLLLTQYAIPYPNVVPFPLFAANATAIAAFSNSWRSVNNGAGVTSLCLHFEVPSAPYGKGPSYTCNLEGVVDVLTGAFATKVGVPSGNPQLADTLGLHVVLENDSGWAVQPYTMLSSAGFEYFSEHALPKQVLPEGASKCLQVTGGMTESEGGSAWDHPASYFLDLSKVSMSIPTAFNGLNPYLTPEVMDPSQFQVPAIPMFNGLNTCPSSGAQPCYVTTKPSGVAGDAPPLDVSTASPSEYSPAANWPVGCPANMSRLAWFMMLTNRLIAQRGTSMKKVSFIVFDNEYENPPDGWACILYGFVASMVQFGATADDLLPSGKKWVVFINRSAAQNDSLFTGTQTNLNCSNFWDLQTGVAQLTFRDVLDVHAAGEQYWMQPLAGTTPLGDIGNDATQHHGGVAPWLSDLYPGCTQSAGDKPGANYLCGCRNTIYQTLSGPEPDNPAKLLGNCAIGPIYDFIDTAAPYNQGCPTFSIEQLGPATSAIEFASPGCLGTLNYCGMTGGACLANSDCASKCGVANIFGNWTLANFGTFLDMFARKYRIAGNPKAPGIMIYDAAFLPLQWMQEVISTDEYANIMVVQTAATKGTCASPSPEAGESTCSAAIETNPGFFTGSGSNLPYCGPCPAPVPATSIGLDCPAPTLPVPVGPRQDCLCDCPCFPPACPKFGGFTDNEAYWGRDHSVDRNPDNSCPVGLQLDPKLNKCVPYFLPPYTEKYGCPQGMSPTADGLYCDTSPPLQCPAGFQFSDAKVCAPTALFERCKPSDIPTKFLVSADQAIYCTADVAAKFNVKDPVLVSADDCYCVKWADDTSSSDAINCNAPVISGTCQCPCACGSSSIVIGPGSGSGSGSGSTSHLLPHGGSGSGSGSTSHLLPHGGSGSGSGSTSHLLPHGGSGSGSSSKSHLLPHGSGSGSSWPSHHYSSSSSAPASSSISTSTSTSTSTVVPSTPTGPLLPPMFIRRNIASPSKGAACGPGFLPVSDVCVTTECATVPQPTSFDPATAVYCNEYAAAYYHVENPKVVGLSGSDSDCWCVAGPTVPCAGSQCAAGSQSINDVTKSPSKASSSKLSEGAIIGIAVGAVAFVIIVVLAAIFGRRAALAKKM